MRRVEQTTDSRQQRADSPEILTLFAVPGDRYYAVLYCSTGLADCLPRETALTSESAVRPVCVVAHHLTPYYVIWPLCEDSGGEAIASRVCEHRATNKHAANRHAAVQSHCAGTMAEIGVLLRRLPFHLVCGIVEAVAGKGIGLTVTKERAAALALSRTVRFSGCPKGCGEKRRHTRVFSRAVDSF